MKKNSIPYRVLRSVWRKFKMLRMICYLVADHIYDLRRFVSWSHGTDSDRTRAQALYAIYKSYHGVEKGLSLKEPRPNFGVDNIATLTEKLAEFSKRFDPAGVPSATSALQSYRAFNAKYDVTNAPLDRFLNNHIDNETGGTRSVKRTEIEAATRQVGPDFFWSRHSIRQYSDKPVAMELIRQAVDMARKTPCVCNRQGVRVHVFERARMHWTGSREIGVLGTCHLVGLLLLPTSRPFRVPARGISHSLMVECLRCHFSIRFMPKGWVPAHWHGQFAPLKIERCAVP